MVESGTARQSTANRLLQHSADAPSLLAGLRALDLSDEKGWLCGRILADFGVEVIKIEPPGGDSGRSLGPFVDNQAHPERSLYWMAYNAGKKGITLDLETSAGRDTFLALAAGAHFVIESAAPGHFDSLRLGYAALSAANPSIILTSITPFGQNGPRRNLKASDLTLMALGGIMHLTGEPDRAPLRLMLDQSYYLACGHASVGSLLAHYHRQRSGLGQHVDISIMDCLVRMNFRGPVSWELEGLALRRTGSRIARGLVANRTIWACKDGHVSWSLFGGEIGAKENYPLTAWIVEEGVPGAESLREVQWERVDLARTTQEQLELWEGTIGRLFARYTPRELQEGGIRRRLTIAAINSVADVRRMPQLDSRGYWVTLPHPELDRMITYPGHFLLSSETTNTIRLRAPRIGEHNNEILRPESETATLPIPDTDIGEGSSQTEPATEGAQVTPECLAGLRVLDFTWWLAGPFATKFLADFGAEVIKVESRLHVDLTRVSVPYRGDLELDNSGLFLHFNTGKKSLTVDVQDPSGLAVVKRLVGWADVVVENFSPGTLERMGLGYETLREIKADIILVSASTCGQAGVEGELRGHAAVSAALAGHFYHSGYQDGEPTAPSGAWADIVQPTIATTALLAAIDYRSRTGKGQWIDVAQIEVMAGFLAPTLLDYEVNGRVPGRAGNRHPQASPHGVFSCRGEDRWCAIAVFTDDEWGRLCAAMGDPAWASEPRFATLADRKAHEDELDFFIAEWARQFTATEIMDRLTEAGVIAGIVQTPADLVDVDPQVKARQIFVRLTHPVIGECNHPAPAVKLSRTPAQMRTAPLLGEHTEYVCRQILGISDEEFVSLQEASVLS